MFFLLSTKIREQISFIPFGSSIGCRRANLLGPRLGSLYILATIIKLENAASLIVDCVVGRAGTDSCMALRQVIAFSVDMRRHVCLSMLQKGWPTFWYKSKKNVSGNMFFLVIELVVESILYS